MNAGKTLFAQLMDFLPWPTFSRYVTRYSGDKGVRTMSCAEQFRVMAFAQFTYRESLRDIELSLSAQAAKLYHRGFREPIRRSTLADANESRDWRIYAEFVARLIAQARVLYASEDLGLELSNTVYALDSTTIDLCVSVFSWAHFRTTKAAVKMHTLLDLRGSIPSFIHVSDGKLHDVHALDLLTPEAGLPSAFAPDSLQRPGNRQVARLPHQSDDLAGNYHLRALQKPLAGRVVLQMDQAASSYQTVLRYFRKRGQDSNLDRSIGLCVGGYCSEKTESRRFPLPFATGFIGDPFREDALAASVSRIRLQFRKRTSRQLIESISFLTGQQ